MPTNPVLTQTTDMMPRFDPNTGQPIVQEEPPVPRFDPNTGQPIVQAGSIADEVTELQEVAEVTELQEVAAAEPPPPPASISFDAMARLKEIKQLLDAGILTQEEFDEQKKRLLAQ